MELSYRGSLYNFVVSTSETSKTEAIGKYRGNPTTFKQPGTMVVPQTVAILKYRGNTYLRFR